MMICDIRLLLYNDNHSYLLQDSYILPHEDEDGVLEHQNLWIEKIIVTNKVYNYYWWV